LDQPDSGAPADAPTRSTGAAEPIAGLAHQARKKEISWIGLALILIHSSRPADIFNLQFFISLQHTQVVNKSGQYNGSHPTQARAQIIIVSSSIRKPPCVHLQLLRYVNGETNKQTQLASCTIIELPAFCIGMYYT